VADPQHLVLFDIDGTLLSAGGAPRRAFRRALIEHFGTDGNEATADFSGKTDPQIVYELMRRAGFDDGDIGSRIDDVFEDYVEGLARELESETRHRLYPGVEELLRALDEDPGVVLGLVTGNVEAGARLKLGHFGLWNRFAVGAFGSDRRVRDELPPIAIERAEVSTGARFGGPDVIVIGDTPADVQCARAAGAVAVAVATGRPSRESLAACGPDLLFESLADWREVLAAVGVASGSQTEIATDFTWREPWKASAS